MTENNIENAKVRAKHPLLEGLSQEEQMEIYKIAQRRVGRRMGLYIHVIVFVLVMALLIILNLTFTPNYLWVVWPLGGWGVGLFFHWLANSNIPDLTSNWEEKEIIKELESRR